MTDMGPRRMDAAGRPPRPMGSQPGVRPQQRPLQPGQRPLQPRPMQPGQPQRPLNRPVGSAPVNPRGVMPASRMAPPQARPATQQAPAQESASPKKSGGWKVIAQFVVGLAVIAAVATTIVWLYYKYYAQ